MSERSRDDAKVRLSRTTLIVLISALVLLKVVLAIVTPVSVDVYSYLQIATRKDPTFSNTPWSYWYNQTLGAWMWLPIAHPPVEKAWTSTTVLIDPSLQLLVFMVKLPMLVADLGVAIVLYLLGRKMFPASNAYWYVVLVWLANPFVTFVNEMMAASDIVPVFATVLGIYLLTGKKYMFSILSIAAGIVTKLFPIFFVPGFLYLAHLNRVRRIKLVVYAIVGFVGFAAYAYWALLGKNIVFLSVETPITQSITEFILVRQSGSFSYNYGGGEFVGIATFCLVLVYLAVYEFRPAQFADAVKLALLVFLVYLTFFDLQFQYVIWVAPLLTLMNFRDRRTAVPTALIYVVSFLFGFARDGFLTSSAYNLLFLNLGNPSNWLEMWLSSFLKSPLADIVAVPLLRTTLAAFMILVVFLLAYPLRARARTV